jgi:hypothetical protein
MEGEERLGTVRIGFVVLLLALQLLPARHGGSTPVRGLAI